jgi:Kdo2-lipid IVA lauroyltransferase/acyltransferase
VKNAPVLHRVEYAAYLAVKACLGVLPHGAVRRVGAGLGALTYRVVGRRRRVALANLARVFPELDSRERRGLARACFRHFGTIVCDSLWAGRLDGDAMRARIDLEGLEHLEDARAAGRGVCVMGAHLGCWEVVSDVLGLYAGGFNVVGRQLDNPWFDRAVRALRERFGNHLLAKRGSVRRLFEIVRDKGQLAILIDQRVGAHEGIVVPFLGHPAVASPVLARVSLRSGAPVVPIFGYTRPGGRYRVVVHPAIRPDSVTPREGEDETMALTRRCLEVVEAEIRAHPGEWMWMHDRWKM